MKKKLIASFGGLLASAGLALAAEPAELPAVTLVSAPAYSAPAISSGLVVSSIPEVSGGPMESGGPMVPGGPVVSDSSVCSAPEGSCAPMAGDGASPANSVWFRAEYLLWWIKDSPVSVPLVTSTPITSGGIGAIGGPGTRVLIGNEEIDNELRQGGRFTIGAYLNGEQTLGVEANYFFLGKRSVNETVNSGGTDIQAIPFFDVTGLLTASGAPGEAALPLGIPGLLQNRASLSISSFMDGAELNGIFNVSSYEGLQIGLIGGFRFLELDEKLNFSTETTGIGLLAPLGISITTADQFETRNRFYGGQLGVRGDYTMGRLFFHGEVKVALGDMHESLDIGGRDTINIGVLGTSVTTPGGIFAQPTNIGHTNNDEFAVIPEVTLNIGAQLTDNLRVFVGYNFLYASDVIRPGDQIDRNINITRTGIASALGVPATGPTRPVGLFNNDDFWAQGINFGLEIGF